MKLKFLESKRTTFKYLFILCAVILAFFALLLALYSDAYYTCASDDLLQYYKFEEDFVLKIKTGNLSFYQFNNYLGASYFSDTYYVPLDIFTLITFLMSFVLNFEMAFGLTEIIKLLCGTLMFAYFLSLRKCSNKAIFITSLLYFVCGYNTTMMAFSAFFSLCFYFPFAAVCIEKYKKGNKLILTLCAAQLLFYNFYLGACTMAFMAVWFIVSYILDNKLSDISAVILKNDPNAKKVKAKAFVIYIGRMFKTGINCAFYMIIGILIGCIIMVPSLAYFLEDSLQRTDVTYYKWSFDSPNYFTEMSAKAMYSRILAEIFTPTYSCSFYAFNNSYITDHISLYITICGLMIMLYVFELKDRNSWIYKLVLLVEVVFLAVPIFYMIFSLNGSPYTRWVGMLNLFNLLIVAHVITETDGKPKLASIGSIVRSVLLIVCILIVANYYAKQLYDVNIIKFIFRKNLNPKDVNSFDDLVTDTWLMLGAILVIVAITIFSTDKIAKKIDLRPFVLSGELVLSFAFMMGPKFYNYGTQGLSIDKENLNDFMDDNLEIPYGNNFSRTSVNTDVTDDYVYSRSFTRTNLHLSDLKIFHSFYDESANDFVWLTYDSSSSSSEERNSKELASQYSIFVHQLLGTRYIVVDAGEEEAYFPEEYYSFVASDGIYSVYENKNYLPFTVYSNYTNGIKKTDLSLIKQQQILNSCYLDSKTIVDDIDEKLSDPFDYESPWGYTQNYGQTIKYDVYDSDRNMIGYYISGESFNDTSFIPSEGIMHFYYSNGGARSVEFTECVLEYEDGRRVETFGGYAFYDEIPKIIWIENNFDVIGLGDGEYHRLTIEYTTFEEYNKYLERMADYSNEELIVDGSKLHLSYDRVNDETNIVALPIAYNEDWKLTNCDYETIKVNGGLLGIVVPKGSNHIEIELSFEPKQLKNSSLLTICGLSIFALFVFLNRKKVVADEETINCSTML